MPPKILLCDDIHPRGISLLREAELTVQEETTINASDLLEKIPGYDAIIVRSRTKVSEDVIRVGKNLKLIARAGVGLDNIDLKAAEKKGIKVISTPEAPTTSVAELTVALILSVLRKIPYSDQELKKNHWVKRELTGNELRSKTIGVLGAGGRIGFETARILREGFQAKVIGYDIIDVTEKLKRIRVETETNLTALLEKSDIVTIHIPYLPATHHLIDENAINHMKHGAILINTSRGDIINGEALLEGLKKNKLAGAGLDVFHDEPPREEWEKELVTLPKGVTVCTCHIGAQTQEAQEKASIQLAKKVIEFFKTHP